ncbi:hypothetical protein I6F15_11840 [Bradyrhizobium sp. BRP14]|nr:hypothetical protein [Bradyrhizobium sp. BRP14]
MSTLSRKVLVERVLMLWHGGRHSTHTIATELGIDEHDVCEIIEHNRKEECREKD